MKWLKARPLTAKNRLVEKWKGTLIVIGIVLVSFVLWKVPERQVRHFRQSDISGLEPKDRIQFEKDVIAAENSARVTLAQILGGFALLVGLYLTYKNIRVAEEGKLTDRFSKAVELLGGDKVDVRLGGVYALERIARDSLKDHWTVMEVLTTFVRGESREAYEKYIESIKAPSKGSSLTIETTLGVTLSVKDLEWALVIREDIQAALTVIGRRKWADREPPHQEINLMGAYLGRAVLFEANLKGANLVQTNLRQSILFKVDLSSAALIEASLVKANLSYANLDGTHLDKAELHGADLRTSTGLTWEQISKAVIDETTMLPPKLERRRKAEQGKKAAAPNQ